MGTVTGKRKREIGLVVPAKYRATTPNKSHAKILTERLNAKKDILEIVVEHEKPVKLPVYQ